MSKKLEDRAYIDPVVNDDTRQTKELRGQKKRHEKSTRQ